MRRPRSTDIEFGGCAIGDDADVFCMLMVMV